MDFDVVCSRMETISPAAAGNFDWLSELEFDTFLNSATQQLDTLTCCQDRANSNYPYVLTQMKPDQGFPLNSSTPFMKPDKFLANEPSSWEAISDQTGCSWSPPIQCSYTPGQHPSRQRSSTSEQQMSQPKMLKPSSWEAISDQTGCSWSPPIQCSYTPGQHPSQQRSLTSEQQMSQPKMLKPSSWEAISDQTGCSWSPAMQCSYTPGQHPSQQRSSTSEQHMSQRQFCLEEVDVISHLPKAQEESYEHLAANTPSLQREMRHSPGLLAIETLTFDAHVMETSNNSYIKRNVFPPDDSRRGKRKAFNAVPVMIPATVKKSRKDSMYHIVAERNRREKLNQRFIALSALIPGLKKMDKASILGDGISYVKQLQERLKMLEAQPMKGHHSVNPSNNLVKIFKGCQKIDTAAEKRADGCRDTMKQKDMPRIEIHIINENILIRIQCEKTKGILGWWLTKLEKLHVSVLNASMLSVSDTSVDLAFTAQIGEASSMIIDGLVSMLQNSFENL